LTSSLQQNSADVSASKPAEPHSPQWFAAYTCSCQEKRVAQHLGARNIDFFLPVYRKVSRWKNGLTVPIERPLFPGYVFVQIDRSERVRVLELPGVQSIVGAGREPIPLPSHEIEMLRLSSDPLRVEPHPYLSLSVGDQARVSRGPLAGMTGVVLRKKNGCRLVLSLHLIMKSVSVEVNELDLHPLNPAVLLDQAYKTSCPSGVLY
jgi:transcription antitermination factor NusG